MGRLSLLWGGVRENEAGNLLVSCLIKRQDGVTAIEYGLIAALIAVAAVAVMGSVGSSLTGTFSTVAGNL
jgi:pilus assembly protein Flp/PilA